AVLIVSELTTNAILHARSDFVVSLKRATDTIGIAVHDLGVGDIRPRSADSTANSGRGLSIVGALSKRWGWEQLRPGKRVWAELTRGPDVEPSG
ncbi:MAG: ATP-binding protein, partial [Jatrophihabitantaceae bacterium]